MKEWRRKETFCYRQHWTAIRKFERDFLPEDVLLLSVVQVCGTVLFVVSGDLHDERRGIAEGESMGSEAGF